MAKAWRWAAALLLAGCLGEEEDRGGPVVATYVPDDGAHVDICSEVTWSTAPPSSGYHFADEHAKFGTYADSVPYGYLVHSLEHGGVVIGYDCPGGCPAEVALAQAWIDSWPDDGPHADCVRVTCIQPNPPRRFILAPDPRLDVRWAASAWGATWKSPRLDTASLGAFARARYRKGPEDLLLDAGVDYSRWGWCPRPPRDSLLGK